MEVFLFILSFISGGVILTVAYITHLTISTRGKQDKLAYMQEQLKTIQQKQFSDMEIQYKDYMEGMNRIKKVLEGDSYRDLAGTNQRINKESTRLDELIKTTNRINITLKGDINDARNDIQNKMVSMGKRIESDLKHNY